jgi:hypothetical protein
MPRSRLERIAEDEVSEEEDPAGIPKVPANLEFHAQHWPIYVEALKKSGIIAQDENRPEVIRLALQYIASMMRALEAGATIEEINTGLVDNRLSRVGRGFPV